MVFSAMLNIIFNIVLIPLWNENAAAISTVLAEMCMFIMNYHYSKDIVYGIFKSKELLKNFVTSIIGCVGIIIICMLCDLGWQSIILKTVFSVILSTIIYGSILVLLKSNMIIGIIQKVKIILKRKI